MKRFIFASLLILASPLMVSMNSNNNPVISVAYAGRASVGGYACTCGCPDCICDPGETPLNCGGTNSASVAGSGDGITQKGSIDSPSSVMLIAFAIILMMRFGLR